MNTRSNVTGPAIALVALTAIWGYNWVVMKVALLYAAPLTFAALRSVLAAAALFGVLLVLRKPLAPARGWALVGLGLLQTTGFVGLVALALQTGAAGKSAILAYTMPFWTLMLAGPLLSERVKGVQWLAVALAAAGLFAIFNPWQGDIGTIDALWALGAAWCWAGGNILAKRMELEGDELLNVSAWQTLFGALTLCVLALWLDAGEAIRWTVPFSLALAYNVVLATALAWLLWLFALSRLSAGATGLASLGTPVFSLFVAWLQLGELPSRAEAVGMALILLALAVLSIAGWMRYVRTPTGT
jgi:drug/metabolite transporter (DMT)-like permease